MTSPAELRELAEVTQADRVAAAHLWLAITAERHGGFQEWMTACTAPILIGAEDKGPWVQAFATHRARALSQEQTHDHE